MSVLGFLEKSKYGVYRARGRFLVVFLLFCSSGKGYVWEG